jgi:16S rRNA C1402 (ribose-2'-O) methylase RsmI
MEWNSELVAKFGDYIKERALFYREGKDVSTYMNDFIETLKGPSVMTREELTSKKYQHYLCVGQLMDFIEDNKITKEAIVVVERIEDSYYEQRGWSVYEKKQDTSIAQYHPVWCPVAYRDEAKDILFLDLHY